MRRAGFERFRYLNEELGMCSLFLTQAVVIVGASFCRRGLFREDVVRRRPPPKLEFGETTRDPIEAKPGLLRGCMLLPA